jgi:hypothetical protein
MTQLMLLESTLNTELELTRPPIGVSFLDAPPAGVEKFTGTEPPVPSDHYNCPIGSHAHSVALPPERQKESGDTLQFMSEIGYMKIEEVGKIPTLPKQPNVVAYTRWVRLRRLPTSSS